jgi:hypothetical protein
MVQKRNAAAVVVPWDTPDLSIHIRGVIYAMMR